MSKQQVAGYIAIVEAKTLGFLKEEWTKKRESFRDEFITKRSEFMVKRFDLFTSLVAWRRNGDVQAIERAKGNIGEHYSKVVITALNAPYDEGKLLLEDLAKFSNLITKENIAKPPFPYSQRYFVGSTLLSFLRGGAVPGRQQLKGTMDRLGLKISGTALSDELSYFRMEDLVNDQRATDSE